MAFLGETKPHFDESNRAQILCASPNCWRRLCQDPGCSKNFYCFICETRFFGQGLGCVPAHGQACSKKNKPAWGSPRAPALRTAQALVMDSKYPPYQVIWESLQTIVVDEGTRRTLEKFLRKSWTKTCQAGVLTGSPEDQVKAFTRSWMSDTLQRFWQSGGDLALLLSCDKAVSLFQQLAYKSALPSSLLGHHDPPPPESPAPPCAAM